MQTLKVSQKELENILSGMPNSIGTFADVTQLTSPRITKYFRGVPRTPENEVTFKVQKLTTLRVLLNTDYEAGVLNQLAREDKPKSAYEKGVNTMPLELCANNQFFGWYKGEGVLQYRPFDNSKPVTQYLKNGKPCQKNELGDCLPVPSKAQNQGTDKEIFWRKLYVKHLVSITLHGTKYELVK